MRSSAHRAVLVWALLVASCSLGDAPDGAPTITIEIETPETIDWRRTVGDIEVAGSRTSPSAEELGLLDAALAELPESLVERAAVRTIYRIPSDAQAEDSEALAFTRGPDIYLTDGTFLRVGGRLEMAEVLAHEMAHAWQYAALTDADLDRLDTLDGGMIFVATDFVRGFAEDVGWRDSGTEDSPAWHLPGAGTGTTPYGATSPAEDMADSVSRVVTGRASELSTDRVRWVESLLDASSRDLASGKPYLPAGAVEVAPGTALYDEARAARLSSGKIEPRSWALPESSATTSTLAREIQDELSRRRLGGNLRRTDDASVARYAGEFVRGDGVRFLVELWDFRDAPGYSNPPPQPVLTYVVLY